ncbi:MAG: creatininase family protein [Sulfolobales archaeon]
MSNTIYLGELTWDEAKDAINSSDFIILPTGSFEQHGLHLPLLTDSIRAEAISRLLALKAKEEGLKVYLLSLVPYGVSEHHIRFPGTVSLDPETYVRVIESIGKSLAFHGAKRLLILNFHGGNSAPLQIASSLITSKYGLRTYLIGWTNFARKYIEEHLSPDPNWGHACEHETSMIMFIRPELVKLNKVRKPIVLSLGEGRGENRVVTFLYFDEISDTGGLGDPLRSSTERVPEILDKTNTDIVNTMKRILEFEKTIAYSSFSNARPISLRK